MNATRDYLALDLGATSGRAILGRFDGRKLALREIHRFPNQPVRVEGALRWDLPRILKEIEAALGRAATLASGIVSVGCDSWGLDHGFLDHAGRLLAWPFSYQDSRTDSMAERIQARISQTQLLGRTAAPCSSISTLCQLSATRRDQPALFEQAAQLLFIPGLVHHHLSGARIDEQCMASTSQLWSWRNGRWDEELMDLFDLPCHVFPAILPAGSCVGPLDSGLRQRLGLPDWQVCLPPGHDTASAFAAAPAASKNDLVISSGTWSMLGLPVPTPICSREAAEKGGGTYAIPGPSWFFTRGIMGLWLLERYRREERAPEPAKLTALAAQARPFATLFDPADPRFLSGASFMAVLADWCRDTAQPVPEGPGAAVRCILESLALFLGESVRMLSRLAGRPVERVVVVGGGSNNHLLNQMTANATERSVLKGSAEAAAVGNVLTQAVGMGDLGSMADIREVATRSWPGEHYAPADRDLWREARDRLDRLREDLPPPQASMKISRAVQINPEEKS